MPEQLVLIDGSGYIFRAFHALPPMTRSDGMPIGAVYGFTNMVMKLIEDLDPDRVIVILDHARKTFRNEIYPDYKANRDEPPEELVPQFPLIRDAAEALALPVAVEVGFEADDLIASYAKTGIDQGMEALIISSDKDLMQLVRPGVTMLDPMKQLRINTEQVIEKFGVSPDKVIDVQSLAGDSSDNVPGVPGIGIKTAAELINIYGDLDTLLAQAEEIKQPKRRENLINFAEQARVSRALVTLREDAPMPVTLEEAKRKPLDLAQLKAFLETHEFKRLLAKIDARIAHQSQSDAPIYSVQGNTSSQIDCEVNYDLVTDIETLQSWVAAIDERGLVAIDTETTSLNASEAMLTGISLAVAPGRACYIPLRHRLNTLGDIPAEATAPDDSMGGLFGFADDVKSDVLREGQLEFDVVVEALRETLAAPHILKIGHNLKYDLHVLSRPINGGFTVAPLDDTMCLSFVLDAGRAFNHKLDDLVATHLGHKMVSYEDICGKGKNKRRFDDVPPEEAGDYAAEDADMTLRLWHILKPRLAQEHKARVYERLERPLIQVLVAMEVEGIKLDRRILEAISIEFASHLKTLEGEIYQRAGESFNIASPKQLGEILFEKMGLQGGKKSKTGALSTGADVLETLAATGVEIAEKVLDWRHFAKLKSTYTDALLASLNPDTGRVHTSYSMIGASTGRLSSSDPNVQNIPVRTPEGRRIREAFIADDGHKLISADYSQIELRLVAHVAREQSMIDAFHQGMDIHAQTASEVFDVPLETMTSEIRRRAKAINFGIIYGISAFGLARQLRLPQDEARSYIEAYFDRFPGIKRYMDETRIAAREMGYVETLFGRRLYIQGIKASNQAQRGFAERQAINAPIQGTAADIIKQAMTRMPGALVEASNPARMLLQVHDELIFECPDAAVDDAMGIIIEVMEAAAKPTLDLTVPLIVEAHAGLSWNEVH